MDITEVRVRLVQSRDERLRAFCSITIDDAFVVRDIRVIAGADGLFVAMPSRKAILRRCGNVPATVCRRGLRRRHPSRHMDASA